VLFCGNMEFGALYHVNIRLPSRRLFLTIWFLFFVWIASLKSLNLMTAVSKIVIAVLAGMLHGGNIAFILMIFS